LIAVDRHSARIPDEPYASSSDDEVARLHKVLACKPGSPVTLDRAYRPRRFPGRVIRSVPAGRRRQSRFNESSILSQRLLSVPDPLGGHAAASVAAFPTDAWRVPKGESSSPACAVELATSTHFALACRQMSSRWSTCDSGQRWAMRCSVNALSVQYQPQVRTSKHRTRVVGSQALARWALSSGEIIPPSVFIPLAEKAGMIHSLGAWMIQSACETAISLVPAVTHSERPCQ